MFSYCTVVQKYTLYTVDCRLCTLYSRLCTLSSLYYCTSDHKVVNHILCAIFLSASLVGLQLCLCLHISKNKKITEVHLVQYVHFVT